MSVDFKGRQFTGIRKKHSLHHQHSPMPGGNISPGNTIQLFGPISLCITFPCKSFLPCLNSRNSQIPNRLFSAFSSYLLFRVQVQAKHHLPCCTLQWCCKSIPAPTIGKQIKLPASFQNTAPLYDTLLPYSSILMKKVVTKLRELELHKQLPSWVILKSCCVRNSVLNYEGNYVVFSMTQNMSRFFSL